MELVIASIVTGVFGMFIAWQNHRMRRQVHTGNGATIGQYAVRASEEAAAAKFGVELVAQELANYRHAQAIASAAADETMRRHMETDERNFAELRRLMSDSSA